MTKKELRKFFSEERMKLSASDMEKRQDLILIRFQQISLPFLQVIHTYQPIEGKHEPDPDPLVRMLQFRNPGMQIVSPKIAGNMLINLVVTDNTEWTMNPLGMPEPAEGEIIPDDRFDLIFIPMLGCDKEGNRIGYGKGFYDRFLANCRKDAVKIGISFLEPIQKIDDVDDWDISLDYCITPQQAYEF